MDVSQPLTDDELDALDRLDSTMAKDVAHVDVMAYRALDAVPRLVSEVRRLRAALQSIADDHGGRRDLQRLAESEAATPEGLAGRCGICDQLYGRCSTRIAAENALGSPKP